MEMAGLRPLIRSAVILAEPWDIVQPMWPCPVLRKRFRKRRRPKNGRLLGIIRSQTRPHLCAVVVGAVGVELLGDALHKREI